MNDHDAKSLVPQQPDTEQEWLVPTGAPEEFGFPKKATLQQRECWRNQERFLEAFAHCSRICEAAATVGLTYWAVARWQREDLYSFVKRMAAAEQVYVEKLEAEADRRGIEGIEKPIYYKGERVDTVQEYSDNLLMFRTKKLRPEYRDNYSNPADKFIPTVTQINIIMPPGVNDGKNLVIDGAAKPVPDEESDEHGG